MCVHKKGCIPISVAINADSTYGSAYLVLPVRIISPFFALVGLFAF
jgi:hypothetical protein